jgi:galactonate dehydratase
MQTKEGRMKITSVDIFQLQWFGLMPAWHPVVIRVNTDSGISGFGEAGACIW